MPAFASFPTFIQAIRDHVRQREYHDVLSADEGPNEVRYICRHCAGLDWTLDRTLVLAYGRRSGLETSEDTRLIRALLQHFGSALGRMSLPNDLYQGEFDGISWLVTPTDQPQPIAPVATVEVQTYRARGEVQGFHTPEPGWYAIPGQAAMYLEAGFWVLTAEGLESRRYPVFLDNHELVSSASEPTTEAEGAPRFDRDEVI